MDASVTELIGLVAGCLTTGSFIPQVIKILKTRDVSGISLVCCLYPRCVAVVYLRF